MKFLSLSESQLVRLLFILVLSLFILVLYGFYLKDDEAIVRALEPYKYVLSKDLYSPICFPGIAAPGNQGRDTFCTFNPSFDYNYYKESVDGSWKMIVVSGVLILVILITLIL